MNQNIINTQINDESTTQGSSVGNVKDSKEVDQTQQGVDGMPQQEVKMNNLVQKRLSVLQLPQPSSKNSEFENFKNKQKSIPQPLIKQVNANDLQNEKILKQQSQEIKTQTKESQQLPLTDEKQHPLEPKIPIKIQESIIPTNKGQEIISKGEQQIVINTFEKKSTPDLIKQLNCPVTQTGAPKFEDLKKFEQKKPSGQQVLIKEAVQPNNINNQKDMSVNIIISNTFEVTKVQSDNYYQGKMKLIKFLQGKYKAKVLSKLFKTLLKRTRYRKNVIKELLQTETSYVQDIAILQEKIIIPLKTIPLLKNEQSFQKLTQNIQSILTVNKSMLEALQEQFNVFTVYQATTKVVVDYIAYFKLYYDYCFSFEEFQKTLENLINTQREIKDFFDQIKTANTLKGADISSYLIKPIQRLPRYVLLFKDLLKHTDGDHPDFKNITKCCDEFSKINTINNQNIGKHLNQLRMFELQRSFPEVKIIHAKNELIFEEACTLYINKSEKSGIIYAFTYQLLLTCKEENIEKVIINLNLNHLSICKRQGDSQYFDHLFSVVGQNDTIQFICLNQESKDKLINDINEIISTLKNIQDHKKNIAGLEQEQSDQQILVHVIGTEERNSTQLKKHTIYITEITIDNILIKIFVRYNQIAELEELVKKKFPKIKIPHFPTLSFSSSLSPKVIEERRILIEKFLQILLCSDLVKSEPESILAKLSLPLNFYYLPEMQKNQIIPEPSKDQDSSNSMKQSATKLIKENQDIQDSFRGSLKQYSKTKIIIGTEAEQSDYLLLLRLMTGEELQVGFEKLTRVKELKDEIAKFIQLQNSNDFKIFSVDSLNVYKVLDEEEIISSIVECQNPNKKEFLGINILKNQFISSILGQDKDKVNLVLRKYYFLAWDLEEQDFSEDPIRFNLIVCQAIDEIKNEKFILNIDQYCFYAASFIYVKSNAQEPQNVRLHILESQDIIQTVIPPLLFKSQMETFWIQKIIEIYKQLVEQIRQIQEKNRIINKSQNSQCVVDRKSICQLVIINAVKQNPLCSMTIYQVECSKDTILALKNISSFVNIFIGINYQGLHLLSPMKQIFRSYDYKQIQEFKSFIKEITLKLDEFQEKLTFITQTGQEIKALMEQYRMLNDLNQKME